MFLDEKQIETNINWLLERGSPPVVYMTHKYILGSDTEATAYDEMWAQVENYPPAKDILSKQQPDGSWCAGGAWAAKPSYKMQEGYEPTSPKYVTTAWILPLLGNMAFDKRDPRIRRACNYLLTFQWPNGYFASSRGYMAEQKKSKSGDIPNMPCHFSLYLLALAKVCMGDDPLLDKSFNLLIDWQREDGGWVKEGHKDGSAAPYKVWDRSCPWSSFHAVSALYHSGKTEYREALHKGLKFLLGHLSIKDETDICQLYYHGHMAVRELLMFSDAGVGLDRRPVQALLEWLMTMYKPGKGHFKYNGKPISKYSQKKDGVSPRVLKYRLYHLMEDDWLTYYLTRVGQNLIRRLETVEESSMKL